MKKKNKNVSWFLVVIVTALINFLGNVICNHYIKEPDRIVFGEFGVMFISIIFGYTMISSTIKEIEYQRKKQIERDFTIDRADISSYELNGKPIKDVMTEWLDAEHDDTTNENSIRKWIDSCYEELIKTDEVLTHTPSNETDIKNVTIESLNKESPEVYDNRKNPNISISKIKSKNISAKDLIEYIDGIQK